MTGRNELSLERQVDLARKVKGLTAENNRQRSEIARLKAERDAALAKVEAIKSRVVGLCGHPDAQQACRNVIDYCCYEREPK